MLILILLIYLLTHSILSLIPGQCFDNVSFTVFRDSKKIVLQRADTVNDEKYATEILAENQLIPVLHTGCFKNLPKLEYITVTQSGVQDIEKSTFLELPQIRVISVTFNDIRVIRNGVFHSLDLVKLLLIGNGIEEIEQHAFYNLTSLELLDLSRNNLHSLKADIFLKTNNLEQINLSNNRILFVYDFFFWDCFAAVENYDSFIDLSSNNISEIERNTFKGVYYIGSLFLNDNFIKKIDPNSFQGLIKGNTLDLRDNILKKLPNKVLFGNFDIVLYDEDLSKEDFEDISNLDLNIQTGNSTLDAKNETASVLT